MDVAMRLDVQKPSVLNTIAVFPIRAKAFADPAHKGSKGSGWTFHAAWIV